MRKLWIVLLVMAAADAAQAVDGVLEINQTCAVNTGCFDGDTAGFPVTINTSGSYRLTSNLSGIGANLDGLYLSASRITIDFNGFSLNGPAIGSGSGNGVTGSGTNGSFAGLTILRNGTIRGFRQRGVALGGAYGVRIEKMAFESNNAGAINLGSEAVVDSNRIRSNGPLTNIFIYAVEVGQNARVESNTIAGNGGTAVVAGPNSVISGNQVTGSGNQGVRVSDGSTVTENTVVENTGIGIWVIDGSARVSRNVVSSNLNTGILVSDPGSSVFENTVRSNDGFGMNLTSHVGYWGNVVTNNAGGGVDTGVNLGSNYCQGAGVGSVNCP